MEHSAIFNRYFPAATVPYCLDLWKEHRFKFIISPKRETKLGDYKFKADTGHHIVTVNGNLNPYSFLTTYIHEVAHLTTFKRYGTRVLPHGKEWKQEFKRLYLPVMEEHYLPLHVIAKLAQFLSNPKASSCSEHGLFDTDTETKLALGETFLKELPHGTSFKLKTRRFQKLEARRTRVVCLDLTNGRKYLVHENAVVRTD